MPSFTVRVGVILVVLGVAGYVMTGGVSLTALIPSLFGLALALCGVLASRSPSARPTALRVAILIAAVGCIATIGAVGQMAALTGSGGGTRPSQVSRASMALILLVYLAFAVRAFVQDALRARAR